MQSPTSAQRTLTMLGLVLAGEAIFMLPFHVNRFFGVTLLEVFPIEKGDLGTLFAIYGIVAMISYAVGGPIADRVPVRNLLALSLVITGLGGLYMAQVPSLLGMQCLFGFWGASTVLTFWAALIRATRDWASGAEQGRAFGWLEGGRGLLAALLATITALVFQGFFPDPENIEPEQARRGIQTVIYMYTIVCLLTAVFVWLVVPDIKALPTTPAEKNNSRQDIARVLKMPATWLIAVVIICAYCGYKALDLNPLYAHEGFGWTEDETPMINVIASWLRPVAALFAGFWADRVSPTRTSILCFAATLTAYVVLANVEPAAGTEWILWVTVLISAAAAFAIRGVYFALLEESRVPRRLTGTAVGIISFIGYTPEVFFSPLSLGMLDAAPGPTGYHRVFWLIAVISGVGLLSAMAIRRWTAQVASNET